MTFHMGKLATTLLVGKVVLGLFFSDGMPPADVESARLEPQTTLIHRVPPLDSTLRLHDAYPD